MTLMKALSCSSVPASHESLTVSWLIDIQYLMIASFISVLLYRGYKSSTDDNAVFKEV